MIEDRITRIYHWIIAIIVIGVLLVLMIFFVILPLAEKAGKLAYLDILVMPTEAKVEINGKPYQNAVYEMEPGTYTAKIDLDGQSPKTIELDLVKNQTTGLYLTLEGDDWRQFTLEDIMHKNSVSAVTPIYFSICGTPAKRTNCDALSINYGRNKKCDYNRCLIITGRLSELSDHALQEAKRLLGEKGYNLDDYQYIYIQNDNR